ncbi:MAG: N-acetylneuraminate lyase [Eubacteriales bacterium]|jgi:N-acetylneuraminate lyase|nr:N-acetylneuraminate lyase [Eubacteriales bacterium]
MKGIFSALINTFDEKGAPAIESFYRVIDYNINKCHVSGLYVNGSTGENFNMPHDYKKVFIKEAADYTAGRVSLIAQVGCNVVEEVYDLASYACNCGYNAISAVTPFYYTYSSDEIISYYNSLADFSPLPVIIYNIPVRTSVSLSRDSFRKLLSHNNIAGVKFTSNDFYLLERIRIDFPEKLIYSGFDEMLLSAAVLGTDGAIGSTYNIIGDMANKVYKGVLDGDLDTARAEQSKINTVVEMLLATGLIPTIKAVFRELGIEAGDCRAPMTPNGKLQYENAGSICEFMNK